MSVFTDLVSSRELLSNLTSREVKGKYKRTLLGQLWSLINPLAQMLIFTAVFSFVIRVQPDKGSPSGLDVFALWLMCGLLPWNFFANVLGGGMGSLVSSENLIKKVYFPRVVLPVSNAASIVVTWLGEMVVLIVALLVRAPLAAVRPGMNWQMAVMFPFPAAKTAAIPPARSVCGQSRR